MANVTISDARRILAESALFEITLLSVALREHIAVHDQTGDVDLVSRGMLARVQCLSEAVSDCISDVPDAEANGELYATIKCLPRPAMEVGHG